MTTIDIKDWKGNELHKLMGNYVKNIHKNAINSDILSVKSGNMRRYTRVAKAPDGFIIDAMDNIAHFSGNSGKPYYYPYKYTFKGYPESKDPVKQEGRDYLLKALLQTPFSDSGSNSFDPAVDSWVNSAGRDVRLIGRLLK